MSTMTRDMAPRGSAGLGRSPVVSGLAFAVISAASFGLSGALAKGLLEAGWSTGAAVLVRIALAAGVLLGPAWLVLGGRWDLLWRNRWLVLVFGLVAVAGCQFFYFQAVARMQVGLALLIEYTAPIAVIGWLWLRHGQRPGPTTLLGAALAIAGLLLVLDIVGGVQVSIPGVLWALGAMVGAATFFVLGAHEAEGLPPLVLAASGLTVGSVALALAGAVGLVPMRFATQDAVFSDATVAWWLPVLGLGLVTAAVAYSSGIAASRRLGSRLASFVALLEVISALGFAWLLLGELPRAIQLLGGLLILAGVVLAKLGEPAARRG